VSGYAQIGVKVIQQKYTSFRKSTCKLSIKFNTKNMNLELKQLLQKCWR